MAISKIPAAGFQDNIKFRNIIINGDMSQAQRGTSQASITSSGYYTVDRFRLGAVSAGTWTMSQDTDVPTGQGFSSSAKLDCTTANGSLSASSLLYFEQLIEGQNLQYLKKGTSSAESTTLSFWVKSNKTGTYICEIFDNDNTRTISKSYTISSADTWEKKTLTFAGDTTGTLGNDNNTSFTLNFWLVAGTDYSSGTLATDWESRTNANRAVGQVNLADSTSNEWYITGVQLEVGSAASDFEFLPVDVNLNRCLRYCLNIGSIDSSNYEKFGIGTNASTTQVFGITPFPVPMRTQPSLTVTSTASDYGVYHTGDLACSSVPTLNANTTDKVGAVTFTVASGLTSGGASVLQENGNSGAYLIWSAEL
jgi:hypothetical protein